MKSQNLLLALVATVLTCTLWAAESGTRLRCRIFDGSKAAVSGASLTLKGNNNFNAVGVSNDEGEYLFVNVPSGTYQLTVERESFSPANVGSIVLDLNEVRVLNVTLTPKEATQVVEVNANQVSIVPQQTFLRGLVDPVRMKELPLNGRNFSDLIYTQPGVTRAFSDPYGSGHAVIGARGTANSFIVDGGDANGAFMPNGPGINISTSGIPLDALDEFSVITSNATAEYGRSAGATVNIVTKSGTEKLHGSLWEFLRNDVLDSRTYFDPAGHKDPFKQNQFGAHFGGKIKPANMFYSLAYEGFRQRQQVPINALVPTPDFLATVTNPAWASLLQAAYPSPNTPVSPGALAGIYNSSFDNGRDQDTGFLRLDRSFHNTHQAFVTLSTAKGSQHLAGDGIPGTSQIMAARKWYGVLGDNWMIRPTLYNTTRFGFSRGSDSFASDTESASVLQSGTARTDGPYAGQPFVNSLTSTNGFPYIVMSTGLFSPVGPAFWVPEQGAENSFYFQDSVVWIKGKHQISAGAEVRRLQVNDDNQVFRRPLMVMDSSNPFSLQSGLVLAQLQYFYAYNNTGMRGFRNWETDFYVADSYRLFPRLTLDYGLRYELNLPPTEANNLITNAFMMQNGKPMPCQSLPAGTGMSQVAVIRPSQFGIDPFCADRNNFAPRVGLAWDVRGDGKTLVRAAYGIFYDHTFGLIMNQYRNNPPFVIPSTIGFFSYNGVQGSSAMDTTTPYNISSVDPGFRSPYMERWHVTVSREVTKDTLLNVSYAASTGNHLAQNESPNFGAAFANAFRPSNGSLFLARNPSDMANNVITGPFGAFTTLTSNGVSRYQSLQAELTKRISRGLTFQASYTWSHSLDSITEVLGSSTDQYMVNRLNNMLAPTLAPGSGCAGVFGGAADPFSMMNAMRCATGNPSLTMDQAAAMFVSQYTSPVSSRANYGDSSFDARHRLVANMIYELPFGRNKLFFHGASGFADKLMSGWQVATIIDTQSGEPLPIYAGVDANYDGDATDRAVATGNLSTLGSSNSGAQQLQCTTWTAGSCTSPVAAGLGVLDVSQRLGRGAYRASGLFNLDASFSKRIRVDEKYSLQIRSEFFNLLNHVNFAPPAQAINNPNFGISSSQLLINNTQSRQIQFGLKLEF
ncbi:MAG: carboxypeptidase regulatory-like domain-containing protein [Acidobacteriia bacterium]|nr:carboxypeptidase regulatory-like domain-containing protein [Terriglobia bacterium]